jgi:molybdate transport system ATP-binding protein
MSGELAVDIARQFPRGPRVGAAFNLPSDHFSVTVLFGPSGCGKTTVLRCLAGLERPDEGHIRFGPETWFDAGTFLAPQARDVGFLFQDYALFPHLSVAGNVGYGLPRAARPARVAELLSLLHLEGLAGRYPAQLSGGQQQRVALARAIARRPRLLLLDEPLSALDAPTREHLRGGLRRLLAALGTPTLMVTHDRLEVIALADRVLVMEQGRVLQAGAVQDVFSRPADVAVARIVGVETVLPGRVLRVEDGLAVVDVNGVSLLALPPPTATEEVHVCVRAEEVLLQRDAGASSARNRLRGRAVSLTPEGPMVRVLLDCGFALTALITRRACEEMALREGDTVTALVKAPALHLIARG